MSKKMTVNTTQDPVNKISNYRGWCC